jgi:plastocyanin
MSPFRAIHLAPLVLGLAAACSGSTDYTGSPNPPPPPPAAAANDVDIVLGASTKGNGAFDPNPKTLSLSGGTTVSVRWVNLDSGGTYGVDVTHRIVADDGNAFDTGDITANNSASAALAKGSYAYHCAHHPTMKGQVQITD